MTYTQAKLTAIDATISDPARLREAATVLLGRLRTTDEDLFDAQNLIARAQHEDVRRNK